MRAENEPSLMAFTDVEGHRIQDLMCSLHCYRRGGESFVKKKRAQHVRPATREEQYQHARWMYNCLPIDQHYTQWTTEDRIAITLLCL